MFDWDAANIAHIARHDIVPEEAEQVVETDPVDLELVVRNGEERIVLLGATLSDRVLIVVVTIRGEVFRVVTARPANRKQRRIYRELRGPDDGKADRNTRLPE